MSASKDRLHAAEKQAKQAVDAVNQKIGELGENDKKLSDSLNELQQHMDKIRNISSEQKIKYEEAKQIHLNWKQQVEIIQKDYMKRSSGHAAGCASGVACGTAVAFAGPTAAMGIATTFGVASTGTAISALSGAAATNAALAWLGGGALAAGGGGMAAGHALLALAGPIGWTISGIALIGSGLFLSKSLSDKRHLENLFALIGERDAKKYKLAKSEMEKRIERISSEAEALHQTFRNIEPFGLNYSQMTEGEQYALGDAVNQMKSSAVLLTKPISGLQPSFTEADLDQAVAAIKKDNSYWNFSYPKKAGVTLGNLLYHIDTEEKERKLLYNSLRKNSEMLSSMEISKDSCDMTLISKVCQILRKHYEIQKNQKPQLQE